MRVLKQQLPIDHGDLVVICGHILHIGLQRGRPHVWFEEIENHEVAIVCVYTGQRIMGDLGYGGTAIMGDGDLVCHYFWKGPDMNIRIDNDFEDPDDWWKPL